VRDGQALECLVQVDEVQTLGFEAIQDIVKRDAGALPLALAGVSSASMVHQHLAHGQSFLGIPAAGTDFAQDGGQLTTLLGTHRFSPTTQLKNRLGFYFAI
jgi:hypothetical protein